MLNALVFDLVIPFESYLVYLSDENGRVCAVYVYLS